MKDTLYNETLLDMVDMYPSVNNLQIKPEVNDNIDYHLSEKILQEVKLKKYLNIINCLKGLLSDIGSEASSAGGWELWPLRRHD